MFGLPFLINLYGSLIEINNIHQKHPIKEHMCKYKVD